MAEPTVQVPVSLIERIRDTYVGRDYEAADAAVSALLALLSQQTPTAEPDPGWNHPVASEEEQKASASSTRMYSKWAVNSAPPSIADTVPGARRCADPNVNRWYCHRGADGTCPLPKCIDPSTIRDVTPPPAT